MHVNDFSCNKNNFSKYASVKSIMIYQNNRDYTEDFTIVMPAYGLRGEYVIAAIKSVVTQSISNIRYSLIIVDNLYSGIIFDDIKNVIDNSEIKVLYYQNESNIGMYGNWNRCIELATTKWVAMLHDDDVLYSYYMVNAELILKRLSHDPKAVYIKTSYDIIVDSEIHKIKELFRGKPNGKMIKFCAQDLSLKGFQDYGVLGAPTCGTIFCRDLFILCGGFDETHYPSSDSEIPELLITKHGLHVYKTRQSLGAYRWAVNSSLKEKEVVGFAEEIKTYADYYKGRDIISRIMYTFFLNEMMLIFKEAQINHINRISDNTTRTYLTDVFNKKLGKVNPSHLKLIIMKVIYRIVYLKLYITSIRYK